MKDSINRTSIKPSTEMSNEISNSTNTATQEDNDVIEKNSIPTENNIDESITTESIEILEVNHRRSITIAENKANKADAYFIPLKDFENRHCIVQTITQVAKLETQIVRKSSRWNSSNPGHTQVEVRILFYQRLCEIGGNLIFSKLSLRHLSSLYQYWKHLENLLSHSKFKMMG